MAHFVVQKNKREEALASSLLVLHHYCNGGKPEPAQGGAITTPAAFTRTTPVSSTQYAVVPVEFNVTGVALTENPVSPKTPHAAGTPAVKRQSSVRSKCECITALLVGSRRENFVDQTRILTTLRTSRPAQLRQRQRVTVAESGREGFLCRRNRAKRTDCGSLVRSNLRAEQVGNCDGRDDQNDRLNSTINNSISEKPFCFLFIVSP